MSTQPLSIIDRAMNRRKAEIAEREERELKRQLRARGVECFLTVADVAAALAVSHDTVLRQFSGVPGVIDLGTGEKMHKRKRRELRIPQDVFDVFILAKQVKTEKATR